MIETILGVPLGFMMRICYEWLRNYGWAIILFTLLTKIILLPVSIWVHRNAIKIVKLSPELNRIKISFFGDRDMIAEEQGKLYKREEYNPLLSLIPLFVQIVLLMGMVHVIYRPMTYILGLSEEVVRSLVNNAAQWARIDPSAASAQLTTVRAIQSSEWATAFEQFSLNGDLQAVRALDFRLLGVDISLIPAEAGGILLLMPLATAFTSWLLSDVQNRSNVLQSEQGKLNQYGIMALSVGLSLYLGMFVPASVAIYWTVSNFFGIIQLMTLNKLIDPKKQVDYQALEETKRELKKLSEMGPQRLSSELKRREKADYKRFFSIANMHLVFYSESNGFYKYYQKTIEYLLAHSNVKIHYITSDPADHIFEMAQEELRIKPYYIGEKRLITLMMKMDADIVVMTLPDLDNFHIKRSYVRKNIEYVYLFHYPLSTHMVLHAGALDHYDTILCVGEFQFAEIRRQEELSALPPKKLIVAGYGQLELLKESYDSMQKAMHSRKKILIAPSWQPGNILDSCLEALLKELMSTGYEVVVRPHPEYVKRYALRMDRIVSRYQNAAAKGDVAFELDFTSNTSLFDSDIVITDWSGAAYEFAFVTLKPVVFIDTPPKINNPDYVKLRIEPLEISLRDELGIRVQPDKLDGVNGKIDEMIRCGEKYASTISAVREKLIAYMGQSGEVSAKYLLNSLREKINSRKE